MILGLNNINVYLKTFDANGIYDDWVDISKYVLSVGQLKIGIDSSEYQIGVYQYPNATIKLNNRGGEFNDVGDVNGRSLFVFKRNDSQIKITYNLMDEGPYCGTAIAGVSYLSDEVEIFKGLIVDDSFRQDALTEEVSFKILGRETLFNRTEVDFASLSNGDLISEAIETILSDDKITSLLTVSVANINVDIDQTIDDVTEFEDKTVREALNELLLLGNSVLLIEDDAIIVKARDESATNKKTFYGQASPNGIEDIVSISNYNNGAQRVFNFLVWDGSAAKKTNNSSISINGVHKKEFNQPYFTDLTKQNNILQGILDEFQDKKQELELTTNLNYVTLALKMLDKINIDYPTLVFTDIDTSIPICGTAQSDVDVLPYELFDLTIPITTEWKIIKIVYNISKLEVTYTLREI